MAKMDVGLRHDSAQAGGNCQAEDKFWQGPNHSRVPQNFAERVLEVHKCSGCRFRNLFQTESSSSSGGRDPGGPKPGGGPNPGGPNPRSVPLPKGDRSLLIPVRNWSSVKNPDLSVFQASNQFEKAFNNCDSETRSFWSGAAPSLAVDSWLPEQARIIPWRKAGARKLPGPKPPGPPGGPPGPPPRPPNPPIVSPSDLPASCSEMDLRRTGAKVAIGLTDCPNPNGPPKRGPLPVFPWPGLAAAGFRLSAEEPEPGGLKPAGNPPGSKDSPAIARSNLASFSADSASISGRMKVASRSICRRKRSG